MVGVYGIYFKKTGKWYVGASKDIVYRLKQWRSELKTCGSWDCNKGMFKEVGANGFDSITFFILERCKLSELKEKEQKWMNELNSISNGYNMQNSGNNRNWSRK